MDAIALSFHPGRLPVGFVHEGSMPHPGIVYETSQSRNDFDR
jgi:hypothetical protein